MNKMDSTKNISLIYFYNVYENTDTLGLKIVLDDNTVISKDYRDNDFKEFVDEVIRIYNNEKKTKNIIINDFSRKKIIELSKEKYTLEKQYTQSHGIIEFNRLHFKIKLIEEYIINLFKNILSSIFFENAEIAIESFNGYKNKFCITYKVNCKINYVDHIIENVIPIIFRHNKENTYNFEALINDDMSLKIEGSIEFLANSINIMWHNLNKSIIGRNINHIDSNKDTNIIKINNGEEESFIKVNFNVAKKETNESSIKNILTKFNYNLNPTTSKQITNNSFLIRNYIQDDFDTQKYTDDYYHVILKPDILKLDIYNIKGYLKENNFNLVTHNFHNGIIIKPIIIDEKTYLFSQTTNLTEYIPTYHYDLYQLDDKFTDFNHDFEIVKKTPITENIDSIEDVKKLTLK